ncbi:MAG: hypothetical protein GEU99_11660 [Luteitalea sp.]|nr:hypothetical protein [Luteitalea sp.]
MRVRVSAHAAATFLVVAMFVPAVSSVPAPVAAPSERTHPGLLFTEDDVAHIKRRAQHPKLAPVAQSLLARAEALLSAPPIVPSVTKRGEPDPPGETKGIGSARRLQGRVFTWAMAYTLTDQRKYRDALVAALDDALAKWRIWVDTAHPPPYDLMTGENALTFGIAYDWLYDDLTPEEQTRLREGIERRALQPYLDAVTREEPMGWWKGSNNWNAVCNGGAAVAALALRDESKLASTALPLAVEGMKVYWDQLPDDGAWNEGTGYWQYGHRYGFMSAEALRRAGEPFAEELFTRPGVKQTGYFPLVFNPGATLTASFGDSNGRVDDPIMYLLGRAFQNPDFVWFQDENGLPDASYEGWPREALTLLWRAVDEAWLPDPERSFTPAIPNPAVYTSIGWALIAPSQPDPPFFLALKNGSLAASHTHLDLNHVSMGVADTLVLRELGSRPYPADYFGPKRLQYYEITTAGHNTLLVGGKGQVPKREGHLEGPFEGPGYVALTGVADGAYETETMRARRHVVFVGKRYFVLLDEIETADPETVELRFHTAGDVTEIAQHHWSLTDDSASVDLRFAATTPLAATAATPDGWIHPLRVLRLASTRPAPSHLVATVLTPRQGDTPSEVPPVTLEQAGSTLTVTIGADHVRFDRTGDTWKVQQVSQ